MRNKGAIFGAMLIIGIGIFVFVSMLDTLANLDSQISAYYEDANMADVFAEVEGISETELKRLTDIPGIRAAGGHMAKDLRILGPGQETIVTVHLMSYDPEDQINQITLVGSDGQAYLSEANREKSTDSLDSADHSTKAALSDDSLPAYSATDAAAAWMPADDDIFLGIRMTEAYRYPEGTKLNLLAEGQALDFFVRGSCRAPDYIYSIPHGGAMMPDGEIYDIAAVSRARMERLLGRSDSLNELGFLLEDGFTFDDVRHRLSDRLTPYGLKSICERADQASADMVAGEMLELISTGTILPVIFMAISIFMLYVVLKKMIDRDRTLIGTMKAFGMTNRELLSAYLIEGAVIGLAGAMLGCLFAGVFGRIMFGMYVDFFSLPDPVYHDFLKSRLQAVGIALLTSILAVFLGVREILAIAPAAAMRQQEPKTGHILKIPAFLNPYLKVQTRIGLRSMGRNPFRGFLIVMAVVFAFSMTSSMLSFMPQFNKILTSQFDEIQVYDLQLTLDHFVTPGRARDAGERFRVPVEAVCQTAVSLRHDNLTDFTLLYGLSEDSALYRIRDNKGVYYDPPKGKLILNSRTAKKLHVSAGDEVELSIPGLTDGFVSLKVGKVISELLGQNAYLSLESFPEALHADPAVNTVLMKVPPKEEAKILESLLDSSRISYIVDTDKIVGAYRDMIESMKYMVDMFALLSVAAGAILIYNISMISLKERLTEIGTLEVLGMTRRELGAMLLNEKLIYFVIGVILGFPGSFGINRLLEILIISDSYDLRLKIGAPTYFVTTVICFVMIMCAWYAEQKLVQRIDLTDTLKARE